MANVKSFPNNQDEYIGAEYVMKWLHGRTSGVFAAENNAAVSAAQNEMAVNVSDGLGWMANAGKDGIVWWNDHEASNGIKLKLSIDAAASTLNRIDRIIVEWKTTNYVELPEIKVLKGSVASNAVAPALTNNSTIRQISLARVYVAAGTTAITASMVTDERLDASVCGLVTESITIDTSMANAQFNDFLERIERNLTQLIASQIPDKSITREKFADDSIHTSEVVILSAGEWENKTQTVSVNDAKDDNLVFVAPDPDSYEAYTDAGVVCTRQGEGTLVFECDSIPSGDILVNVTCFVDGEGGEGGGSGGGGGGGYVEGAVLYTEQDLTPEQQEQARQNIGAMSADATISLSTKQINALDALFKVAAYTEDASAAYKAFCDAFGLTNPNEPSENVVVQAIKIGSVSFEGGAMKLSTDWDARATLVPIGQYLKNGVTYKFSLGSLKGTYNYGIQVMVAKSAGITFPYVGVAMTYDGVTERVVDSGYITNDYVYEPDRDNCILAVNFKKIDGTSMGDSDYATILENFTIEETAPIAETSEPAYLLHRSIGQLNDTSMSISAQENPKRLAVYSATRNAKCLAFHNGTAWGSSDYSPLKIPAGAMTAIVDVPSTMRYGAFIAKQHDTSAMFVMVVVDSGWVTDGRAIDVSGYNDGNHYLTANVAYISDAEIPADFDTSVLDVYFVDANGNRMP